MRTVLLILVTFALLGGVFLIYVWLQPTTSPLTQEQGGSPRPPMQPATRPGAAGPMGAGAGEDVTFQVYDKTGELASQFRAARYDPRPDNTVDVTRPRADFFLSGGEMLRIDGARGEIVVPDAGTADKPRAQAGPPSRGSLHDVVIQLFPSPDAAEPVLTCRVNNVAFDNDTFRIATEAYDAPDGKHVPADQVPVEVRGVDYDFDGRGLTIRWNERDRRLQLLEIAHGERLVVKNAEALGQFAPTSEAKESRPTRLSSHDDLPENELSEAIELIAFDESAPAQTVTPAPAATRAVAKKLSTRPSTRRAGNDVYRATFLGEVRVFQGEQQVGSADVMNVDFQFASDSSSRPKAERETAGGSSTAPVTKPTTRRRGRPVMRAPGAAAPATTRPATRPAGPLVIRWTGKLRVAPPAPDVVLPGPGKMALEMIGNQSPVTLDWQGAQIRCASLTYRSGDEKLSVRSSTAFPQVMVNDAGGASIQTVGFQYAAADGLAVLRGAGRAELPISTEPGQAPAEGHLLTASWSKSCTLRMPNRSESPRSTFRIERATIEGDVSVEHPQLILRSGALDLDLQSTDSPGAATRPGDSGLALRGLKATQDVRCTLNEPDRQTHIETQSLSLTTAPGPDGSLVPRTVVAEGDVHTYNDEQHLRAGRLEVALGPVTPAVPDDHSPDAAPDASPASQPRHATAGIGRFEVRSVLAQQDVKFTTRDGVIAEADQLSVQDASGSAQVTLSRQPFASVTSGAETITGPVLKLDAARQKWEVVGAGTLSAVARTRDGVEPTPVRVAWQTGLTADGKSNRVDWTGGVELSSQDDDGTTTRITGKGMTALLSDRAPTTSSAGSSTRPSAMSFAGGLEGGAFGSKSLRSVSVHDDVEFRSEQTAADGSLLRRVHLNAPELRYELTGDAADPADAPARVLVPAAGTMLFQDYRAASTRPAAGPAAGMGEMRGATAFQWAERLVYDAASRTATMEGGVAIVHQNLTDPGPTFRLEARRVAATMEPVREPTTAPTSAPTTAPTSGPASSPAEAPKGLTSGMRPTRLAADGSVRFTSARLQFEAAELLFDPGSDTLIARGTEHSPVVLLDAQGVSQGSFGELIYNTRTDQLTFRNFQGQVRP